MKSTIPVGALSGAGAVAVVDSVAQILTTMGPTLGGKAGLIGALIGAAVAAWRARKTPSLKE